MSSNTLNFKRLSLMFSLMSFYTVSAFAGQSVNSIIEAYYPFYYEPKDCRGVIAKDGTSSYEDSVNRTGYCIEIDNQVEVETEAGKRLYIAIIGDVAFSPEGGEDFGSHADSGLVGMLILKPDDSYEGTGWQVEYANPTMNAGAFGNGLHDWDLIQVAPDKWGFINVHSDSHGSISFAEYLLLTPDPYSKSIIDSHITAKSTFENNPYAPSGCSKDKKIEYCTLMQAKLGIDRTVIKNGFYPLKMTVNGYDYNYDASVKRTFDDVIYRINYEPTKGYVELKDDPFE